MKFTYSITILISDQVNQCASQKMLPRIFLVIAIASVYVDAAPKTCAKVWNSWKVSLDTEYESCKSNLGCGAEDWDCIKPCDDNGFFGCKQICDALHGDEWIDCVKCCSNEWMDGVPCNPLDSKKAGNSSNASTTKSTKSNDASSGNCSTVWNSWKISLDKEYESCKSNLGCGAEDWDCLKPCDDNGFFGCKQICDALHGDKWINCVKCCSSEWMDGVPCNPLTSKADDGSPINSTPKISTDSPKPSTNPPKFTTDQSEVNTKASTVSNERQSTKGKTIKDSDSAATTVLCAHIVSLSGLLILVHKMAAP